MDLETPCLLVDFDRLNNNIKKMASVANKNQVALRPHIKTHKSVKIARMQTDAGASGITVAKVSEAEVMAQHGFKDLFIAYPVIGQRKIERILKLNLDHRIIVGVDSFAGAAWLSEAAVAANQSLEVRLEVDIGFERTGVPPEKLLDLAQRIHALEGIRLTGIFSFKAMTKNGQPTQDREGAGLEEGQMTVACAQKLRDAGLAIEDVSVGSTPTAEYAAAVPGVTEIRPGTYVFNDMATVKTGACEINDCAASVLVTVVSCPDHRRLIIDGGSKTFSTDNQPDRFPHYLSGFGTIIGEEGLVFDRMTEEHGILHVKDGARQVEIGEKLRIIPNHICTTVNLHTSMTIHKGNKIQRSIPIDARGCIT